MIRPNELSNRAEDAALARVEAIVRRLDGAPIERFTLSPDSVADPDTHALLASRLESEADRCGRRELLDDVRRQVRSTLVHRFSPLSARTGIGFPSPVNAAARPEDEAVIVMAILDAVSVAVVEDRLDLGTAALLADPGRQFLGLPPLAEDLPSPSAALSMPEPSAADWAEAAVAARGGPGSTSDAGYRPLAVTARVVLATIIACTLGPAALFIGIAGASTLVGIAAALAVVVLCWTFATYRR